MSDVLADLHLEVVPNEDGKVTMAQIPAHRAILAAGSDYFRAMLTSTCQEAQPQAHISIVGYSEEAVRSMLEYIYNSKLSKHRPKDFSEMELLRLADQYQLAELRAQTVSLIKRSLTDADQEDILYNRRCEYLTFTSKFGIET